MSGIKWTSVVFHYIVHVAGCALWPAALKIHEITSSIRALSITERIEEVLSDSTYRVIRSFQLLSTFSTVPRTGLVYFHSGTYILWLEVHHLPEPKL